MPMTPPTHIICLILTVLLRGLSPLPDTMPK